MARHLRQKGFEKMEVVLKSWRLFWNCGSGFKIVGVVFKLEYLRHERNDSHLSDI